MFHPKYAALSPSLLKTTLLYTYTLEDCVSYLNSFGNVACPNELCALCHATKPSYYIPKTLECSECEKLIAAQQVYFVSDHMNVWCKKCTKSKDTTTTTSHVNDRVFEIPYVMCTYCKNQYHTTCAMAKNSNNRNDDFMCVKCQVAYLQGNNQTKLPISSKWKFTEADYPKNTHMAQFIYDSLNIPSLFIREVLCTETERMVMVMQKQHGVYVLLFMMIINYGGKRVVYDTELRFENEIRKDEIYISYLDSVQYYNGPNRSDMYRSIILSAMDYARIYLGATKCFLWSFTPKDGDDYIIPNKPKYQKRLPQKILNEWYIELFEKGISQGFVKSYMNLVDYIIREDIYTLEQLPYFKGDIWTQWYDPSFSLLQNNKAIFKSITKYHKTIFMCYLAPSPSVDTPANAPVDVQISYPFTKDRVVFLISCINNMFQFDTLRKASYNTQMILYYLKHPMEDFSEYTCNTCKKEIIKNRPFYCTTEDVHVCDVCFNKLEETHKQVYKKC